LYFFAEGGFCECGIDEQTNHVNGVNLLQAKLNLLDPNEYPHIVIEGAAICDKMRPGEFGGFAYFITCENVEYISTWQWVHEMQAQRREPCTRRHPSSTWAGSSSPTTPLAGLTPSLSTKRCGGTPRGTGETSRPRTRVGTNCL